MSSSHLPDKDEIADKIQYVRPVVKGSQIFTAIGFAISDWSSIEDRLVILVSLLLRTTHVKAGIIMYSITSFHTWITLIDELFDHDDLSKPKKREWIKFQSRLREAKDTRDRIAHNPVTAEASPEVEGERVWLLRPTILDYRSKTLKQRPLDHNSVNTYSQGLTALRKEIDSFVREMAVLIQGVPASDAQISVPPKAD